MTALELMLHVDNRDAQLFYHKDKWVSREMNAFFELIQNQGTADMARRP